MTPRACYRNTCSDFRWQINGNSYACDLAEAFTGFGLGTYEIGLYGITPDEILPVNGATTPVYENGKLVFTIGNVEQFSLEGIVAFRKGGYLYEIGLV